MISSSVTDPDRLSVMTIETHRIGEYCVKVSFYSDKNWRRRSIFKNNHDVTIMTSSGHVTSSGACAIDSPSLSIGTKIDDL